MDESSGEEFGWAGSRIITNTDIYGHILAIRMRSIKERAAQTDKKKPRPE
jgi:hypothetical protein